MNKEKMITLDDENFHLKFTDMEKIQIFVIDPMIFLAALIVLIIQIKNRKTTM